MIASRRNCGTTRIFLASLASGADEGTRRAVDESAVLIVNDDHDERLLLTVLLERHGFRVWQAASGAEALELYAKQPRFIPVALLKVQMREWDGPKSFAALRGLNPRLRGCFLRAESCSYTGEELVYLGAAYVLNEPFSIGYLAPLLRQLLRRIPGSG